MVSPLRRATGGSWRQEIAEDVDAAIVSKFRRSKTGDSEFWNDLFTTVVRLGGGALQGDISLGKAGALSGTQFSEGPLFTDAGVSQDSADLGVEASGVSADLNLLSLGQSIALNAAGQEALAALYTATSIIGALNELEILRRLTGGNLFTNASGAQIEQGRAVRISGNLEIDLTHATANDGNSNFIGVTESAVADTATGIVLTDGPAQCYFPAGMGAVDHAQSNVFLGTTGGEFVVGSPTGPGAPSGSGNVKLEVGRVIDSSAYNNGSGGLMLVMLVHGPRTVAA